MNREQKSKDFDEALERAKDQKIIENLIKFFIGRELGLKSLQESFPPAQYFDEEIKLCKDAIAWLESKK